MVAVVPRPGMPLTWVPGVCSRGRAPAQAAAVSSIRILTWGSTATASLAARRKTPASKRSMQSQKAPNLA